MPMIAKKVQALSQESRGARGRNDNLRVVILNKSSMQVWANMWSTDLRDRNQSMKEKVRLQPDIRKQPSVVEHEAEKYMRRGTAAGGAETLRRSPFSRIEAVMLPKFHCELNGIERVWGRSKWYCRHHCSYNLPGLRDTVPVSYGLLNIPVDLHRHYSRKVRSYLHAYSFLTQAENKAWVGAGGSLQQEAAAGAAVEAAGGEVVPISCDSVRCLAD